jgi:transcription elongation factor GreA
MGNIQYIPHSIPPTFVTPEGYNELKKELSFLLNEKRKEISDRFKKILDDKDYGEEHTELEDVRFEQSITEKRIGAIKQVLTNVEVVKPSELTKSNIQIGHFVSLLDKKFNDQFTIRMVSSIEANADNNFVSDESPLGEALLGKSVGDIIQVQVPAGKMEFEVVGIELESP